VLNECAPLDGDLVNELRSGTVDAEVVDHTEASDDQDDVDEDPTEPEVVDVDDQAPQDAPEPATADVEPQGSTDENDVPATPSDPFAQELADDVPQRFVMELRGETYVRRAGYARIARANDLRLSLEEVVGAHETDWEHSKYRARVTDASGDVLVDSEVGSAHIDEEDLSGAAGELDELAATRAARRAVEWATGAGMTVTQQRERSDRARADGGQI
jgi:hypothetical protein